MADDRYHDDLKKIKDEVVDTGDDVDEIKEDVDDLEKHVNRIKKEVLDTGKDIDEIKKEVVDSGDDIDEIKEDVDDIGEDVDEIKKDLKDLKKSLSPKPFFSRMRGVLPEKFEFDDFAQQVVGATILSAPFAVTEEVWGLAGGLVLWQVLAIIVMTLTFDILLLYFTKFQKIENTRFFLLPVRISSLLLVTYTTSFIVLFVLGVIGGKVTDPYHAMRLIVLVGLFANIGAGTADLIK